MKNGLTELVFILDKSGSMSGLEADTIGGYNSMLSKQQAEEGECRITTLLFNNSFHLLHDRIDLKAVGPITENEYRVGGSTALLDAIGLTVDKIGNAQKNTAEDYRAEKVLVVIITDGEENSSREYSSDKVKMMIERQKNRFGWEFIFLGANIDSVETAGRFGIGRNRAVDYVPDKQGVNLNYSTLNSTVAEYRKTGVLDEQRLNEIRRDAEKRGKKKQ